MTLWEIISIFVAIVFVGSFIFQQIVLEILNARIDRKYKENLKNWIDLEIDIQGDGELVKYDVVGTLSPELGVDKCFYIPGESSLILVKNNEVVYPQRYADLKFAEGSQELSIGKPFKWRGKEKDFRSFYMMLENTIFVCTRANERRRDLKNESL